MKKMSVTFFALLFALLTVFAGTGCAQEAQGTNINVNIENSVPNISVQGTGKVETIPDEAIVSFGVTSDSKSLNKAYKDNTEKMNAVIAAVKGMGIASKDIQTSSYSVSPIYPTDERGRRVPGKPASFRVSQQVTVKIRDISTVGEVIDTVIASGTNTFNGINFTSSKIVELGKEAKVKAAQNAEDNAKLVAKGLGVKIGKVLKASTSSVRPYPVRMMAFGASMEKASPDIQAGSMEVTATCNVVYKIMQ